MSNSKLMPVIVNKIKLSEKTSKLTGTTTFAELQLVKPKLFSNFSDKDLLALLEDIYNGKLTGSNLAAVKEMSEEEKRNHAIESLSLQLELVQEMPRLVNQEVAVFNAMSMFMKTRLNVSNQTSKKYVWQTTTLAIAEDHGYTEGCNFSEIMLENFGLFTYLHRVNSFTPEIRENRIVSSPKRAGKGGDLLIKDGKLIFNETKFVIEKVESEDEVEAKFQEYQAKEIANAEEFKHDATIDIVENTDIPVEVRDKKTGYFSDEYQKWLNEYYAESTGIQVGIEGVKKAA